MKKYFLLVLFVYSINSFSQFTLNGKILDKNNNEISGVEIHLPQMHKGAITDIDGNYSFINIPKGTYKISVLYIGFSTITDNITIEKNTTKNYTLTESAFEIDEVIISTPFNKLQSHNVMKVESIKLNNKTVGATNLTEKLSKIAGVTNIGTGNGIGKPVIRGLSGNRVVVYNQGIKYENFQSGEKHGLGINENGISSVEVIKGPASLLYGSDALGGVIYLVPEKFESTNKTSVNVSSSFQSNSLGINSSIGVKTTKDKLKFLARGSYNTQSDYTTANNVIVTNSRFNNKDFKTGFGFENDKFNTVIRYNYNQAFNGITHDIDEQNHSKEIKGLYQELNNHILSMKNSFYYNSFTLKTTVGFTHHNRNLYKDDVKNIDMSLNTFNYDINAHLLNLGKLETIVGVQGMYQTNTNNSTSVFLPDAKIIDFGAFVTSNYEFNNNTLQGGIRFDNRTIKTEQYGVEGNIQYFKAIDKSLSNLTGAIGLKSELAKNFISRINFALGFRAPNLSELTSHGFHEGRYEFGNNDLKNESNFQIDANFEYSNKSIEFFINGFYNQIKNYIYLAPTDLMVDSFDVFTYNQNDAKLFGGELGFHYHPLHYNWLHFKTSGETVIGKNDDNTYLPRIPALTIKNNIKVDFNINKQFTDNYFVLNNRNVFKQQNISDHETVGQAYTLFDVGVGSVFKLGKINTNITMNINNLFNKSYIDHLSVLKEDNIENQGRNWMLGFDIKF